MENLPRELPDMEYDFSIDVTGDTTGKKYSGNFKFLIPDNKSKAKAARYTAELNGEYADHLDPTVQILHYMIAFLRFSLVEAPNWWKASDFGYALYDYNVVDTVYTKVQDFQKEWFEKVWGSEEDDGEK